MTILSIVLLLVLGIVAIIDWKFNAVPSVFLTGILFFTLVLNTENLAFGVLAGLLMLIVYDIDDKRIGVADFKVMAIIGLMISTLHGFIAFTIIFLVFQFAYVVVMKSFVKRKGEYPFIPCLYAVYIALWIIGVIA